LAQNETSLYVPGKHLSQYASAAIISSALAERIGSLLNIMHQRVVRFEIAFLNSRVAKVQFYV